MQGTMHQSWVEWGDIVKYLLHKDGLGYMSNVLGTVLLFIPYFFISGIHFFSYHEFDIFISIFFQIIKLIFSYQEFDFLISRTRFLDLKNSFFFISKIWFFDIKNNFEISRNNNRKKIFDNKSGINSKTAPHTRVSCLPRMETKPLAHKTIAIIHRRKHSEITIANFQHFRYWYICTYPVYIINGSPSPSDRHRYLICRSECNYILL